MTCVYQQKWQVRNVYCTAARGSAGQRREKEPLSSINEAVTIHFQSTCLKLSALKERTWWEIDTHTETVANPKALRIDIMPRLTNQSTGMERPSFERLFDRNGAILVVPTLIAQDKETEGRIQSSPPLFSIFKASSLCVRRHCPLVLSRAPRYFSSLKVRSVTQSSPRPLH